MLVTVNKLFFRKGQVSVFFISVMATLIAVTFVTINIGKIAKDKTHADNAADAGALAAASVMATAFNYVADENDSDKNGDRRKEYNDHYSDSSNSVDNGSPSSFSPAQTQNVAEKAANDQSSVWNPSGEAGSAKSQKEQQDMINNNQKKAQDAQKANQEAKEQMAKTMDNVAGDDQQNDYSSIAVATAMKILFYNAGVHHRLGKINQKRFSQFLEQIRPGSVQSGQPMTFFFVDGAGRAHTVTGIIGCQRANSWQVQTPQDSLSQTQQKLQQSSQDAASSKATEGGAEGEFIQGQIQICLAPCFFASGKGMQGTASGQMGQANSSSQSAAQGEKATRNQNFNSPSQLRSSDYTPWYVTDINHSLSATAMCFQFHMGGPVKGMRGDVDVPTFYPPVQSFSRISFRGQGSMGGQNSRANTQARYSPSAGL